MSNQFKVNLRMSCYVFKCSVDLNIEFTTSFASKTSGSDHSWLDVKGGLCDFSPRDITTLMTCRTSKTPLCATGKPFDGDSLAVLFSSLTAFLRMFTEQSYFQTIISIKKRTENKKKGLFKREKKL